jgi:hypothetical protein
MPTQKTCAECGREFTAKYRASQRCCSYDCHNANKRGRTQATAEQGEIRRDVVSGDSRTVSFMVHKEIRNEKDLIEVCGVDLKEWRIADGWECVAWESSAKNDDGEIVKRTLFRVKARFVRNHQARFAEQLIELMFTGARQRSPRPVKKARPPKTGVALEFGPYDAHFGLKAWGDETRGPNYDLDIATEQWAGALDKMLGRVAYWDLERVYFVIGNDLAHYDSRSGTTYAGTQQDADTRYHKLVGHLNAMLRDNIERMAAHVAPVSVVVVPGNHDTMTAFHIGMALESYFHNNKNVTVDNGPSPRKYVHWGKNLICLTHGDAKGGAAKFKGLANIMAQEQREVWGQTVHREIHAGHLHHEISSDHYGVIVRRLLAMTPLCDWASRQGYGGSVRGVEGFLWHKEEGLVDQPRVVIE